MQNYRQAVALGMGQRVDPDLFAARKELGWRGRMRASRCVRRGEVAWDVPSARFAAAQARTVMRQPMLYGKRGTMIVFYLLVLVFIAEAIASVASGPSVQSIFWVGFAIWFVRVGIVFPSSVRNAPQAFERNEAYLREHDPSPPSRAEIVVTKRDTVLAMAFTGVLLGALFALFGYWIDPHGESVGGRIVGGALFGFFMVIVQRWAVRRKVRQETRVDDSHGNPPMADFQKPSGSERPAKPS